MNLLSIGLSSAGVSYAIEAAGAATRESYVALAEKIGAKGIAVSAGMLQDLDDEAQVRFREKIEAQGMYLLFAHGLVTNGLPEAIAHCAKIGLKLMGCTLTGVLEGARAAQGDRWPKMVAAITRSLADAAAPAADAGITLAIENHQDFTSSELVAFCEQAGENVGICFDVGNALAVGEDPVAYARTVASRVKMLHLKDYRVSWTDEGYRLVRCPIGDGAVSFVEVAEALASGPERSSAGGPPQKIPALLQMGAMENRHIRLLTPQWWQGYPPRSAPDLAAAISGARRGRMPEDEDWRTPLEKSEGADQISAYETEQLNKSVANLKTLGFM